MLPKHRVIVGVWVALVAVAVFVAPSTALVPLTGMTQCAQTRRRLAWCDLVSCSQEEVLSRHCVARVGAASMLAKCVCVFSDVRVC
jgi:hypothetical protein